METAKKLRVEDIVVSMWEVKVSSLGNVYLSKQYTNMPDDMRKLLPLKRFQVFEQNCQVFENPRLIIQATKLKAQEEETRLPATNIYPFCAIKMQLYQTKIREVGQALAQKMYTNPNKAGQS